jgi:hypothetical protein|tara:strand:+ start:1725 stop:1937 length:213 start_codon:yes stop_codon:yes gene_type:complete
MIAETLTQYEIICLVGGLIGVYVKLNAELLKLKGRVGTLEKSDGEVKALLKELCEGMQDIKILLAEKGIK